MATRRATHNKFPDFGMTGPGDPKVSWEDANQMETAGIPDDLIPQPVGYRVLLKPKPAAKQIGMIATAARTRNADLATRTIGQLVAIGALAWKGEMEGIDYKKDPVASSFEVGDWVVFRQHGAQKIKIGKTASEFAEDEDEDQCLLILSDTDIFVKLTPEQADKYYDWMS